MGSMTHPGGHVTAGIDTHRDTHVAAVLDSATGRRLGVAAFDATKAGHEQLAGWLRSHGTVDLVGIEGTGAYGAGVFRHLHQQGLATVEVDRPDRRTRRLRGKSDPVDAEAAARAALSGTATGLPKARNGTVEAIRPLLHVHSSAVKDRTRAINQFKALIVTANTSFRDQIQRKPLREQLARAAHFTFRGEPCGPQDHARWALRELARRVRQLDEQIERTEQRLRPLVATAPALIGMLGVGPVVAAQLLVTVGDNPDRLHSEAAFAHLCGVSPVPASSGQIDRHRLNRGGDRRANNALHRIALVRMAHDPDTRAYVSRRTTQGKSDRDIMRCLKRYIARQVYRAITNPPPDLPPDGPTLRKMRKATGRTLRDLADQLGCHATRISQLERQLIFSTTMARRLQHALEQT